MSENGFRFVDEVTSDLTFVASGARLADVFVAAADALLAATVDNPEAVRPKQSRALRLTDTELDLLLLRFLNELIYLRDAHGLLLRAERVELVGEHELAAELVGEAIDRTRHRLAGEVKAATAHGLRVSRVGAGWEARVTLDV